MLGKLLDQLAAHQCAHYFKAAGYTSAPSRFSVIYEAGDARQPTLLLLTSYKLDVDRLTKEALLELQIYGGG